jgi:hypothetical protein
MFEVRTIRLCMRGQIETSVAATREANQSEARKKNARAIAVVEQPLSKALGNLF